MEACVFPSATMRSFLTDLELSDSHKRATTVYIPHLTTLLNAVALRTELFATVKLTHI